MASSTSQRVLLFDIDGTLITSGGAGARALEQAFVELADLREALREVRLDGATDVAIVREALTRAGRADEAQLIERLLARYTELLPAALDAAEGFRLLDGVTELLQTLEAQTIPFGLCTGNVREGARHKLRRGGVWEPFARGFLGGFGSDGEVRADIVRAALRRASEHHGAFAPSAALVIGDTPRDIQAAHAAGVPALGVATGRHSAQELRDAGADQVVESLAGHAAWHAMGIAR